MKNLLLVIVAAITLASCEKQAKQSSAPVKSAQMKIDFNSVKKAALQLQENSSSERRRNTPITVINQTAALAVSDIHTSWTFGNIQAPPADYIHWTQLYTLVPNATGDTLIISGAANYAWQDSYYQSTGAYLTEKDWPYGSGTYTIMLGHITENGWLVLTNAADIFIP